MFSPIKSLAALGSHESLWLATLSKKSPGCWIRGMVWGGRWEVGFRMGNTCIPMEDSCPCMAKPIQYCKVFKKRTKKKQFLYVLSIHPSFSQSLATTVFFFYCLHAAAAAAKSLQSCLTPCDPIDGSPSGSTVPGILQARTLEWGAIAFSALNPRQLLICFLSI